MLIGLEKINSSIDKTFIYIYPLNLFMK